jgi:hypothetical protein
MQKVASPLQAGNHRNSLSLKKVPGSGRVWIRLTFRVSCPEVERHEPSCHSAFPAKAITECFREKTVRLLQYSGFDRISHSVRARLLTGYNLNSCDGGESPWPALTRLFLLSLFRLRCPRVGTLPFLVAVSSVFGHRAHPWNLDALFCVNHHLGVCRELRPSRGQQCPRPYGKEWWAL